MLDRERLVAECRAARAETDSHLAIREVVTRAVADPAALVAGIGAPTRACVETLFHAPDLTILNVVWGPNQVIMPHDHAMWAVIGVYAGREDNIFWRQLPQEAGASRVEAAGARSVGEGDTVPLGRDIVHSVCNPLLRLTAGIHVYGGDFFGAARREWDPEKLAERPFDRDAAFRSFEAANARLGAASP